MIPFCSTVLSAVDASANQNGPWMDASHKLNMSAIAISTGASTGTLNIQVSNDVSPSVDSNGLPNPTNFINLTSATVAVTAASIVIIPAFVLAYRWVRASYVKNNGSAGTVTVQLAGNGF